MPLGGQGITPGPALTEGTVGNVNVCEVHRIAFRKDFGDYKWPEPPTTPTRMRFTDMDKLLGKVNGG